jgi:hypothetical protein
MQRRQMIGCLAAGIGLAAFGRSAWAMAGKSFADIPKSLWVWRTPLAESTQVLELARQYRFNSVFYSIPPSDRPALFVEKKNEVQAVHAFRDAGIGFHAVTGDPGWCRRGGLLPRAVGELLDFQNCTRLLDGLCLDIEPHALPEWKAGDREKISQGYLDVLSNISLASRGSRLVLTAAQVPVFANLPSPCLTGQSVLEEAVDLVDQTVMMAYRNSPDRALRLAEKAVGQLEAARKPWWFGVSTYRQAREGVSYAGSSYEQLSSALMEIDLNLDGRGLFYRGIAINDYPSLTSILRR